MSEPGTPMSKTYHSPRSDRMTRAASPKTPPRGERGFFHHSWSRLKPRSLLKWRLQRLKLKETGMARPTTQQGTARTATAIQKQADHQDEAHEDRNNTFRHSAVSVNQCSQGSMQHTERSGRCSLMSHYQGDKGEKKLEGTGSISEVNTCPHSAASCSPNHVPGERRWSLLENKLQRPDLLEEAFAPPPSKPSLSTGQDSTRLIQSSKELDERKKALRILESGDIPIASLYNSPATVRHRRSYQLATDPRIDPQQYSDFKQFLEQEIATDIALRTQIWKSLTQDLGQRAGMATDAGTSAKPLMLESSHSASKCERGTGRVNRPEWRRTARLDIMHSCKVGVLPRNMPVERRRAPASSFLQFIAQYVKPDMPVTIYTGEPHCETPCRN
ncbi:hypothetical protein GGR54DRAFT_444099 [Hypoxylon sp. NC1633]|nr:hypothetical protein GGR54DRAFT_444099 [Hypoxylon sp. NC1633]